MHTHTRYVIISSLRAETRFYSSLDAQIICHSVLHLVVQVWWIRLLHFRKIYWGFGFMRTVCSALIKTEMHRYNPRLKKIPTLLRKMQERIGFGYEWRYCKWECCKWDRSVYFLFLHRKEAFGEAVQSWYGDLTVTRDPGLSCAVCFSSTILDLWFHPHTCHVA